MFRRPPRSTPFPTRRSSDLLSQALVDFNMRPLRNPLFLISDDNKDETRPANDKVEEDVAKDSNPEDRKSTRLNSSHTVISYAVFCLKKKKKQKKITNYNI